MTLPDITYPIVIAAAKTWFRLGDIDVRMSGVHHIPRSGGALRWAARMNVPLCHELSTKV